MLRTLTTPRLTLRPMGDDDIDAYWRLLILPDVRRYLLDDELVTRDFVAGRVAIDAPLMDRGMGVRIMEDAEGFAGYVAIKPVPAVIGACIPDFAGDEEISYALHPDRWGRGYVTEALAQVLADRFAARPGRIVGVTDMPNARSRATLERAGFREIGDYPGPLYRLVGYVREPP